MWLPAKIRIEYYQTASKYNYKRARMQRSTKNKTMYDIFVMQAKIDAERGRAMLFRLIELKEGPDYAYDL